MDVLHLLDGLEDGLLVFDETGLVVHTNAAARAIIARCDALMLDKGVLRAAERDAQHALSRAMANTLRAARALGEGMEAPSGDAAERTALPPPLPLQATERPWPIVLRFFVAPTPGGRRMGLIKLRDTARQSLPEPETIAAATPLTVSEARVGRALLEGDGPAEIAAATGLSEHTVRSHIRAIRTKLGVSRQSGIVAHLARLMGG